MKKFGLGKKDKSGEAEDPNRNRLFGKSSKSQSPAPTISNPYAVQSTTSSNPYATQPSAVPNPYGVQSSSSTSNPYAAQSNSASPDPYLQPTKKSGYGDNQSTYSNPSTYATSTYAPSVASQPPPYTNGYSDDRSRNDKSPVPAGGYGGGRYADPGAYGAARGYGADRYGSQEQSSSAAQRPGGYGGFGRTNSQETMDTQAGRDALFGGARERYETRQQQTSTNLPPEEDPAQGGHDSNGATMDMGYGHYQDRQLTAEEQEEEDVQATKAQIRTIKQQDVASTRNALRIAEQAEQTGRETLERLAAQGERIHNTEKNLDLAANQNRLAEEKAKELKHLNRSMWAMHVGNPFTKSRRDRDYEDAIITQHHEDRVERESTRQAAYESQARRDQTQRDLSKGVSVKKGNLAERSKYQFEPDSEDEAMENEIDSNLGALMGAAGRLNQVGRAMGREVDQQNKHLDRIAGKADRVDDQIYMNRSRLDRIK